MHYGEIIMKLREGWKARRPAFREAYLMQTGNIIYLISVDLGTVPWRPSRPDIDAVDWELLD